MLFLPSMIRHVAEEGKAGHDEPALMALSENHEGQHCTIGREDYDIRRCIGPVERQAIPSRLRNHGHVAVSV